MRKVFLHLFRDLLRLYLSQMKDMGQAGGGFTEYEWFGENLSIMPVLNRYILITLSFWFMMCWEKAQISKHPVMIAKGGESCSQFRWFTIAKIEL